MPIVKYVASVWRRKITKIHVEHETDCRVKLENGRWRNKEGKDEWFVSSFDEAKSKLAAHWDYKMNYHLANAETCRKNMEEMLAINESDVEDKTVGCQ